VLLDDGFQHRRIARRSIVLVDATRSPFADHLLPRLAA
jgi:tetraacyldisaccharide-1-P 4'-kinase